MAQNIKLKRSSVAGKIPTTAQLEAGEIAINTADGKLYFERDDSTIQTIVTTNAIITGSLNINGSITGSDVQIAEWGSISASLVSIQSGANNLTLDNVTDNGSTTTNNITVGRITSQTTGLATTGLFTTTDGENTFIIQSSGSGGTNPGKVTLRFRDHNGALPGDGLITYGGLGADIFTFENNQGAKFKFQGSPTDQEFWLYNGGGSGSMLWGDDGTEFIVRIGTGTTQFYGNARTATTASYALTASFVEFANIANKPTLVSGSAQIDLSQTTGIAASATSASFATTASFATSAALVEFANVANKPTLVSSSAQINLSQATGTAASAVSASYASSVDFANITGKPTLVSGSAQINLSQATGTAATAVTASYALTASYVSPGAIAGTVLSASYAATASSADSFTVRTALTASGLRYPTADGVFEGQVLQTDTAGNLTFGNVAAVFEEIYNAEATTLTKGTALYVSGAVGAAPKVYRADASDPAKMPVTFVAMENIGAGLTGRGITLGLITGIDMTGYPVGEDLFVNGNGALTNTRPTGSTDIIQPIGIVTKTGNGGQLNVLNPGPVLLPNLTSGKTWVGDSINYPVEVFTSSLLVTQAVSSSLAAFATTASYALKAESVGELNQNVTIVGNLNVFGTSSFTYVTSSQLVVDDSFISVNIFEPAERFGGLKVYDSGSLSHQATASLAWDSLRNHWVYVNASGSTYSGGGLLSGPRNTGSLGEETYPTFNTIVRGQGGDHLYDSNIKDNDTAVQVGISLQVTGSATTTGKAYIGTVDNYGSDPDKFLSIVSGEVVYRTGAQLLSDIGGQTAGTFVQNDGSGGTARYIMRYADSNSATTSSIYEDTAGRIGIKTTAPSYSLDINGQARVSTSSNVGAYVKTTSAFGAVISYQDSTTPASEFVTAGAYGKGFVIGTDGQVKVIVDSTGSIGVGTLTPVNAPDERGITISGIAGAGYYFDVSSETTSLKNNQGTIELNYSYGGVKFNAPGGTRMELASVGNLTLNRYGQGNFVTDTPVSLLAAGNNSGYVMEVTHLKFNSGTTTVSGSLIISGSTDVIQQGIKVTGTGSLTVTSISTTSYDGAFLDYLIVSGSNKRAGTLTTVWTASDIEWKDTSTLDLGSTDGAEFAPAINGSNADLVLSLPTGTWTVKGHLRYM
jgi:hypothetical protein